MRLSGDSRFHPVKKVIGHKLLHRSSKVAERTFLLLLRHIDEQLWQAPSHPHVMRVFSRSQAEKVSARRDCLCCPQDQRAKTPRRALWGSEASPENQTRACQARSVHGACDYRQPFCCRAGWYPLPTRCKHWARLAGNDDLLKTLQPVSYHRQALRQRLSVGDNSIVRPPAW